MAQLTVDQRPGNMTLLAREGINLEIGGEPEEDVAAAIAEYLKDKR